ncbi:putative flavonoid 3-hydroxylase [Biscogniauxia mediterranea]|nr:putative flavonoid 3-hydroxylase [Biscogniauxia mediterranea]
MLYLAIARGCATTMPPEVYWTFFVATVVLYPIALVIYRVCFHPLAKFPGPKLAAATELYELFVDLNPWKGGTFIHSLNEMHDKYGPIVRINPHEIHVRDSTWLGTLYTGPAHGKRNKYAPFAWLAGTPRAAFGTVEHDLHRLRRSAINPMFSKSAIAAAAPVMYDHVENLLNLMDKQINRDGFAEVRTNYLAYSTSNIFSYSIGQPSGLLEDEKRAVQWRRSIGASAEWTLVARHFTWLLRYVLKMPRRIMNVVLHDLSGIAGSHHDMSNLAIKEIESHGRQGEDENKTGGFPNVFQLILSNDNLPPCEKTPSRMAEEAFILIGAGGETTARAMTAATYFVLSNKDTVLPKLKEELLTVMPDPLSRPSVRELERLPWLTAVIKESLRVMALFTSRFPVVSPDKPLQYKEWIIPAGTPTSMSTRDILHDPGIFERPNEFLPERWLPSNPNIDMLNRYFVPFSHGNRVCVGMNFAYAELYVVIASIFRRKNLELYDTIRERDIDIVRDCFLGETAHNTKGVRVKYTEEAI